MKLFELENLKVSEIVNFKGEDFVLERIQLFRNHNIEYMFIGDNDHMKYFSIIVTKENDIKYNGGNIFEDDEEFYFHIELMKRY